MYVRKIKEHKINMVKKEFARLGRICDVVRATGYGRTLVHCIVNNHFETIPTEFKDPGLNNTCDMNLYPVPELDNFETFGELQYIIDKLSPDKRRIITETFIHGTSQKKIGQMCYL
jgi:DNA-directed RNA polymerase specialized sigma24 family protein